MDPHPPNKPCSESQLNILAPNEWHVASVHGHMVLIRPSDKTVNVFPGLVHRVATIEIVDPASAIQYATATAECAAVIEDLWPELPWKAAVAPAAGRVANKIHPQNNATK